MAFADSLSSAFASFFGASFASTVKTPTGDEIVEDGWDEEITLVKPADPLILEICARKPRSTVRQMQAVKIRKRLNA